MYNDLNNKISLDLRFFTPDIKLNSSVKINIGFILKIYSRIEMHFHTVLKYFCF